jgi:hypothetical protein
VFDRVKKGDTSLLMELKQPLIVCGDVMVEFFNKPKMMAKVSTNLLCITMTHRSWVSDVAMHSVPYSFPIIE